MILAANFAAVLSKQSKTVIIFSPGCFKFTYKNYMVVLIIN
jgi:hypothetical protein